MQKSQLEKASDFAVSNHDETNITRQSAKVRETLVEPTEPIDISGTWRPEHASGQVYIFGDGKCIYKGFLVVTIKGKWSCTDPQKRVFSIYWDIGFTDVLTLSADGQRLVGVNNVGDPVSFVRNK